MTILVTGSSGLIGSEAVAYFSRLGTPVIGIDNNLRRSFFGDLGDTQSVRNHLLEAYENYTHYDVDIRESNGVDRVFSRHSIQHVVHCAAQPSHDWAASNPVIDFDVNARATLNLLEAFRRCDSGGTFVYLSTNKVYGDSPNDIPLVETATRYDFGDHRQGVGISEDQNVDQTMHSLFGVSKLAGDLLVQEYGKYFALRTVTFRGGCLTGPNHRGAPLHGFLSYMVRSILEDRAYQIIGHKGKQVRDQIHSFDVVRAIEATLDAATPGSVYNLGGGYGNAASLIELKEMLEQRTGRRLATTYVDTPRIGDHICYYSDMTRFRRDFPSYGLRYSLSEIVDEMIEAWTDSR